VKGEPRPAHAWAWAAKASRTAVSAGVIAGAPPWWRSPPPGSRSTGR
jgi:hypothetical protein